MIIERTLANKQTIMAEQETEDGKKNKPGAGRPGVYTREQMRDVIDLLIRNNFNVLQTSRETGIDQRTIKIWANKAVIDSSHKARIKEIAEKKDEAIEIKKDRVEKAAYDAKEYLIGKIVELSGTSRRLYELANALKAVHDVTVINADPIGNNKQTKEITSVLQIVQEQIIKQKNPKKIIKKNGTSDN